MKDFYEFFKSISDNQRALILAFTPSLPVIYTILYLFVDGYSDFDFIERAIFAISATVTLMTVNFFVFAAIKNFIGVDYSYMTIIVAVGTLIVSIFRDNISGMGIFVTLTANYFFIFIFGVIYNASNKRKRDKNTTDNCNTNV